MDTSNGLNLPLDMSNEYSFTDLFSPQENMFMTTPRVGDNNGFVRALNTPTEPSTSSTFPSNNINIPSSIEPNSSNGKGKGRRPKMTVEQQRISRNKAVSDHRKRKNHKLSQQDIEIGELKSENEELREQKAVLSSKYDELLREHQDLQNFLIGKKLENIDSAIEDLIQHIKKLNSMNATYSDIAKQLVKIRADMIDLKSNFAHKTNTVDATTVNAHGKTIPP